MSREPAQKSSPIPPCSGQGWLGIVLCISPRSRRAIGQLLHGADAGIPGLRADVVSEGWGREPTLVPDRTPTTPSSEHGWA